MRAHPTSIILVLALVVLAVPGAAAERVLTLDPAATEIGFDLEATGHDVHGTLALRDAVVHFDPDSGAAWGEITIDARRADTGSKSRDEDMHEKVLESESFPLFVFTAERVTGELPEDGAEGPIDLVGTLSIHGADHPLTMPATVRRSGDSVDATVTFDVPYVDWGMHNPSIFFLRVADVVSVTVSAKGTLVDGDLATAPGGR